MIRYSPSQLSVYGVPDAAGVRHSGCRRKWHFQWVGGFKPPQTASQALGTEVHKAIEDACASGEPPKDPRARAGFETLIADVADVTALRVEGSVELALPPSPVTFEPRAYVMVIDAYDASDRSLPVVTDHKTGADMKYAKASHELAEDVQMISYAYYVLTKEPQADQVKVQHNFIPTRGAPKAILTSATLDRAHVESRWRRFLPVLDQMDLDRRRAAGNVPADGLENGECDSYGGCPHRARCLGAIFDKDTNENTDATQQLTALMRAGETNMTTIDIKEKLAAIRAAAGNGATNTAPQQAVNVAPASAATATGGEDIKAKLQRLRAAVQGGNAAPEATPPAPVTRPAMDAAAATAPSNAMDAAKAKLAALKSKSAPAAAVEIPTGAGVVTQHTAEDQVAKGNRCSLLCLNCAPTQGMQAVKLETLLAPILETIAKSTGKNWQMHAYREGTGLVCDGISTLALPRAISVDTSTPLAKVALEALIARADVIIEGRAV